MPNKKTQKKSAPKKATKKVVKKPVKKTPAKKVVKKVASKKPIKKVVKKVVKKPVKKVIVKKAKPAPKAKAPAPKSQPKGSKQSALERKLLEQNAKAEEVIAKGKKRGFVTYDEIIKTFPDIENNILFLDELYEKLSVAGIDVLEGGNLLDMDGVTEKVALKYSKDNQTYDSIQMYLKEIGQYPLIAASEEKDLAKRIEQTCVWWYPLQRSMWGAPQTLRSWT